MPDYYMTFGVKYHQEKHKAPLMEGVADPEGYVLITAPNLLSAQILAFLITEDTQGNASYASLHEMPTEPEAITRMLGYFPHGEVARLSWETARSAVEAAGITP